MFKKGDEVKCIVNTTTGPYVTPTNPRTFHVTRTQNNQFWTQEFPNQYFWVHEFEKVKATKEDIEKEIVTISDEYESKMKVLHAKIAWLEATGNTEYSPTEAKVWHVLQEMKTMTNDVDKAKAIAQIIEN